MRERKERERRCHTSHSRFSSSFSSINAPFALGFFIFLFFAFHTSPISGFLMRKWPGLTFFFLFLFPFCLIPSCSNKISSSGGKKNMSVFATQLERNWRFAVERSQRKYLIAFGQNQQVFLELKKDVCLFVCFPQQWMRSLVFSLFGAEPRLRFPVGRH